MLTNIRQVVFDSNDITNVPNGAFANTYPKGVGFNHNPLANLAKLGENCKNLKGLRLLDTKLTYLPDDFFDGCDVIYFIQISHNQLESINWMKSLGPSIGLIRATDNRFSGALSSEPFTNLKWVSTLLLENNQITSFDSKAFQYMRNLGTLNLEGNNLTSFDDPYPSCQMEK